MQPILWVLLALLHIGPAAALFAPRMLTTLYGVAASSDNYALLQHRAALFLVIVVIAFWAAFDPSVRRLSSVAVGISMVGFLFVYWTAGAPPSLRSIAIADVVGLPVLALASYLAWTAQT